MSITYNSQESEKDDNGKGEKGDERVGVDVRVAVLEYLGQYQPSNDEHEGSVWVQTFNEMSMILNRHYLRASYCVCIICQLCQEGYL